MSDYIRTINQADAIGDLWRRGLLAAVLAVEAIVGLGFYGVTVGERGIVAWLNGVRFEIAGGANV